MHQQVSKLLLVDWNLYVEFIYFYGEDSIVLYKFVG